MYVYIDRLSTGCSGLDTVQSTTWIGCRLASVLRMGVPCSKCIHVTRKH